MGSKSPLRHALFSYCHNSPVTYADQTGKEEAKSIPGFGDLNSPAFFNDFLTGGIDISDPAQQSRIERVPTVGLIFYYDVAYQYTILTGNDVTREQSRLLKASAQEAQINFWDILDSIITENNEIAGQISSISEKQGLLSKQLRATMESQLADAAEKSVDNNSCVIKFECTWRARYHWFYGFEWWMKKGTNVMYFEYSDWLDYLENMD